MTRRFLVVGHTQSTRSDVPLDDITGKGGRIDVLARAVTAALCLSHGLRTDTEVWCVIDHPGVAAGPRTLRFDGAALRSFNPDERSTAALFRKAFAVDVVPNGHFEAAHPGVDAALLGLSAAFDRCASMGPWILLDRDAPPLDHALDALPRGRGVGFIVSDHQPFTVDERAMFAAGGARPASLGTAWLQGNAAVILAHAALDRRAPAPSP